MCPPVERFEGADEFGAASRQGVSGIGSLHDSHLAQFPQPIAQDTRGDVAARDLQFPEGLPRPQREFPQHAERPAPA